MAAYRTLMDAGLQEQRPFARSKGLILRLSCFLLFSYPVKLESSIMVTKFKE